MTNADPVPVPAPLTGKPSYDANATPDRYRSLVEDSSYGFFAFDAESGLLLFLNSRACDLLDYLPEDIKTLRFWELIALDQREAFIERCQAQLEGQAVTPDRFTYTLVRKDLSTFRAEISKKLVIFKGIRVFQGTIKDVTDYERFQQKLEHAQRLDTIAVMADGLADSLLNAVSVVQQNVDQIEAAYGADLDLIKHVAQIKGATRQIDRLSKKLLAFSRGGYSNPVLIDLNAFIAEIMPLLRQTLKRSVRLTFQPAPERPTIRADAVNLQTALSAVVANAEEAIIDKGQIIISTETKVVDPAWSMRNPDLKPGRYVGIGIEDNGTGMDAFTVKRVCEPYFTTKFHGRGLGMAAVYGIVKRHQGWLSIQSALNQGTWIRLYFPAADQVDLQPLDIYGSMQEASENAVRLSARDGDPGTAYEL